MTVYVYDFVQLYEKLWNSLWLGGWHLNGHGFAAITMINLDKEGVTKAETESSETTLNFLEQWIHEFKEREIDKEENY